MPEVLLEIDRLGVAFRGVGTLRPALRDVSLTLHRDETLGLVGESGSGKSTVLFAAMRHLAPNAVVTEGSIRYRGTDLLRVDRAALDGIRGRRMAMVFQDPGAALNPAMTIGGQIGEVLRRHRNLGGAAETARVAELLALVRLDDPVRVAAAYPHQLSGGMRQRAMIAMALAGEAEILLMDEPTTALDVLVQAHVLELTQELRRRTGAAVLFVSHDLGAVSRVADRIGVLYAGELMELGGRDDILLASRNPYTLGLLAAVPRLHGAAAPRGIPGFAAGDPDRFRHCVFAERCHAAEAICRTERPALREIRPGHLSRCHFAELPARIAVPPAAPATAKAAPRAAAPLLAVENLAVEYRRFGLLGGSAVRAVEDVSLSLGRNRCLATVGESGSGKSTLARAILRLEPAAAGRIVFAGEDIAGFGGGALRRFRRRVQIVFQNPTSSLNPRKTVLELVARPLRLAGEASSTGAVRDRVRAALTAVGLGDSFLDRLPRALSGGEKQRVALARAFAAEPELVILDEPTTALDVSVQAAILELLAALRARTGCSYLLVSHDLAVVRQLADDIVVMRAGRICEAAPAAGLFGNPTHPYTAALLAAVPEIPVPAA